VSDFAVEFYLRMKQAATGRVSRDEKRRQEAKGRTSSKPYGKGREPVSAGDTLNSVLSQFAWEGELAKAELFVTWPKLVGEQNALNSTPEELQNGQLLVRCKSTAWATQLRLMHYTILERVTAEFPSLKVESIRFVGPDAPNWKKGKFTVPGRGPRDTYG
jgi:predicted nucleic acid-binding Zn ribbon protein